MTHFLQCLVLMSILGLGVLASASPAYALRKGVSDWYIDRMSVDITLREDGGLDVVEDISADCGTCVDKHGIFRVIPYQITTYEGDRYDTPITLTSITDAEGVARPYTQATDRETGTITWKIGDPYATVQGVHHYRLTYRVDNAVRDQDGFQELYWNTIGAYWTMDIDHANIALHFPDTVSREEVGAAVYAGPAGTTHVESAAWVQSTWRDDHTLAVTSTQGMTKGDDITLNFTFFTDTFALPDTTVIDAAIAAMGAGEWSHNTLTTLRLVLQHYGVAMVALPFGVLFLCYGYWSARGRDPRSPHPVIAEYDPPRGLSPLELNGLARYGSVDKHGIVAELIELAHQNVLTITEQETKKLFGLVSNKDYRFTRLSGTGYRRALSSAEQYFLDEFFQKKTESVLLSEVKEYFPPRIPYIQKTVGETLIADGLLVHSRQRSGGVLIIFGAILCIFGVAWMSWPSFLLCVPSGAIMIFFGVLMPKYTPQGVEVIRQLKGFRLFMDTAEKYRQRFVEQEGRVEALLPYAVLFGITTQWLGKMKDIGVISSTGDSLTMHNIALSGAAMSDLGALSNALAQMVSDIGEGTTVSPQSSGSDGGGGFSGSSGGGGGGGGGGGW